jgi:hypothetical protein
MPTFTPAARRAVRAWRAFSYVFHGAVLLMAALWCLGVR